MNKEELWYVVEKFTNIRLYSKDGPVMYSDYDRARKGAAWMSTDSDEWYTPIRVSEYYEIYG